MIIILHGADTFRSRGKLRQIIAQYQKKHVGNFGFVRFEGGGMEPGDISAALRSDSLFRAKQLVVIERPDEADQLAELVGANDLVASTDTIAVVWFAGPIKSDSRFAKLAARKAVQAQRFDPLERAALTRWVARFVRDLGAAIEPNAVAALCAAAGSDTWRLANELEKLVAHAGDRPITVGDVAALVDAPASPRAFAFADALAGRDRARALALLHEHLEAGDSPQVLVGMIGYALRTLHLVQRARTDAEVRATPVATLAKTLALHPFVVTKTLKQAERFPQQEVGRAMQLLADTDWYMKTGRLEPAAALERFVMAVTVSLSRPTS